ncbi:restriction endonuclease subunit S [Vibrio sp. TRT 29B02]|uniref:restriction endonuclease subunit S n=1 Tax=Vibrio sp. TRT 29B02 TaxID=3418508 RepID=UPI003CEEDB87
MSELPKGWTKASFDLAGDYTDYVSNGSFASLKENVTQTDVEDFAILLRLKDFNNSFSGDFKYITESSYNYLSKSKLEPGDLFLSNVGAPGKTFIIPDLKMPMSLAPNGIRVRASSITSNKYLHYFISSPVGGELIDSITGGNAQQKFNKTALKKSELPLAPLNEQIRIANKLDSILAKVDKVQARLDKIPAILKRFRQSVLAAATSGELTKEWREELGIEWSNNVFAVEKIAKKEKYSLGIGPFGSNLKVADYRSEGHPLVFVREIRARQFGGADTKFVEHRKFIELAAHRVKPGNILITKMGDPPGDVAIYPDDCAEAVITSDCIKLDVNEELINKQFVFHYMQSEHFQSQMRAITAGVAQQKVNLKNFKGLTLLAPTMDEQIEINRIISGLMDRANRAEKQYLDAKARLDRLTQSILAKAFRGELVPQDPNDEPAEKLLERILAEKEQSEPKKTTRKCTTKAKTAEKE